MNRTNRILESLRALADHPNTTEAEAEAAAETWLRITISLRREQVAAAPRVRR